MWVLDLLVDEANGVAATFPIVQGVHTLGRKGSSISFPGDRSVSRKHAEIRVGIVSQNDPSSQPVFIKDVGSKLKTFVNNQGTGEANREVQLQDGDTVKIGSSSSRMRLRYQALRLCGTQLSAEDKAALKGLAKTCGGSVTRKWDARCTHLVSPVASAVVTEKLVIALAEVRPVVHMGWLKALAVAGGGDAKGGAEGGESTLQKKPLGPVPDTAEYRPVVTRRGASFPVRDSPDRKTHLAGDFLVALRKEDVVDKIVENAGGGLCRAYAMSDADFAKQDWQRWADGRRAFFVQPVANEPISAEDSALVASRGGALQRFGMEGTTKQQLAESVLYLQPLLSASEAMQASSSSAAAAMGFHTASEAWGKSQSASSQVPRQTAPSSTSADRTNAGAPATADPSDPAMPPPTGISGRALPQRVTAAEGGPAASASAVPTAAAAAAAHAADGSSNAAADSTGHPPKSAAGDAARDSGKAVPQSGGVDGNGLGGRSAATVDGENVSGGKEDQTTETKKRDREEEEERREEAGAPPEESGNRGPAAEKVAAPPTATATATASTEQRERKDDTNAIVGKDAAGDEISCSEGGTGDDIRNADGEEAPAVEVGATESARRGGHDGGSGDGAGCGGGGREEARAAGQGSESERLVKRKRGDEREREAREEEPSQAEATGSPGGRGSQRSIPASCPSGWMTAHNASSQKDRRHRGRGGGQRGREAAEEEESSDGHHAEADGKRRSRREGGDQGGGGLRDAEDEDEKKSQPEAAPWEPAVTEKCRLVTRAYSRAAAPGGYSRTTSNGAGGGGGRRTVLVPNFKRFKKNAIMYGGEGLAEYVPMAALRSTLPKESERELVLAAEQQQLEEEEADAERLFTQNDNSNARGVGSRARAPRGRAKRR